MFIYNHLRCFVSLVIGFAKRNSCAVELFGVVAIGLAKLFFEIFLQLFATRPVIRDTSLYFLLDFRHETVEAIAIQGLSILPMLDGQTDITISLVYLFGFLHFSQLVMA